MRIRTAATAAATGLAAIALTVGAAGAASASVPATAPTTAPVTASADLNGDGTAETVSVALTGDNEQTVSATVDGHQAALTLPGDSYAGAVAPKVTDLNGDGRAELVLVTSRGANTDTLTAVDYDGQNLRQLVGPDSKPFTFAVGGGIASHLGYNCSPQEGGRVFGVVGASADNVGANDEDLRYTGSRTVYTLKDGALSVQDTAPFSSLPVTDPLLVANPDTCS